MKISCIMPIVQVDLALNLLKNILENTRNPDQLILLDNSGDTFNNALHKNSFFINYTKTHKIPTTYITHVNIPPKTLNETWTQGFNLVDKNSDLITVLNDDLIINNMFFECIEKTADSVSNRFGVFCPYTTKNKENVFNSIIDGYFEVMYKREGWAFTMRREFFDKMKPIPKELKTFCGDDWIFLEAMHLGYKWVKLMHNPIYHYVGATVKYTESNKSLDADKLMFTKLTGVSLKELGNRRLNKERFNT